jgi:hypothetical protein
MALCCDPSQCPDLVPPPPPPLEILPGMNVMVAMADNTRLITDIYVPAGSGPWPVILHRTPYNPDDQGWSAVHAGNAAEFNQAGLVYVVQTSRGHHGSEGARDLFANDHPDGRAMIELLAAQSWCNGRIMMRGHSAPGIESYLAAPNTNGASADLAAAWVEMATPDMHDTVYQGGVFRKQLTEEWLRSTNQDSLLPDVVANATNASWWSSRSIVQDYAAIATPIVHLTGWFDIFTKDQIDAFVGAQQAGAPSQYLIVGPWTHDTVDQQQQGELTFPAIANLDTYAMFEEFAMRYLLDQGDISGWPAVRYYTMGDVDDAAAPGNEWRTANTWPPFTPNPRSFYLHAGGLLDQTLPAAGEAPDLYNYDPQNPVPTVGGNNLLLDAGPYDQRTIEARNDVLTYTTAPLGSPIEATGAVQARIFLQCSTPDTDLLVRLSDVYPDGRSMMITEGTLRLRFRNPNGPPAGELMTPGLTYEINLELWPTSIIFNTGHRIRIAMTSSSDPRFDPNPNTGDAFRANSNTQVATITILHDASNPSAIVLPSP